MKRYIITEEEVTLSKLIEECEIEDVNIQDILSSIDCKFENYKTNVQLINISISLLLNCNPSKDDCEGINIENLEMLLNILKKE